MIGRREFIAGLGSAAAWPVVARAQQPAMPVIGLLQIGAPSSWNFTGFRQGLKDMGYVEGPNLAIEVRWADDDPVRLREMAADLVHRRVRVIVTLGSTLAARTAKAATDTIPIVFGAGAGSTRPGSQPQSAGRQRYWNDLVERWTSREAAWNIARIAAQSVAFWFTQRS